jgi:uncharacterized membrane protein
MWLIIGLVIGAWLVFVGRQMKAKGMAFRWYEWILGIVGMALLLFTIQNFFGSRAELEPKAANMFLLATGLPGIILLVLTRELASRHKTDKI